MKNKSGWIASWVYVLASLLLIFLLARVWMPVNYTLAGHDSGLPLDVKSFFLNRLWSWDSFSGFGVDTSHLFGSLTLHAVDFLSAIITGTIFAGNWFNIFFWLAAMFMAAYTFSSQLKERLGKYFKFIFPPLIVFNFYIFQSLFMLERAKYGVMTGTLLFLAIFLKYSRKEWGVFKAAFLSAIVFTFFNGGSLLGIPLYGNLFVIIFAIAVFYLIEGIITKKFSCLLELVMFLFLTAVLWLLVNSYQIVPYLPSIFDRSYVSHFYSKVIQSGKDWLIYMSQDTSLIDIFRFQAVPMWYSDRGVINVLHSYANIYSQNVLLIFVSYLFPVIAFLAPVVAPKGEQRKTVILFSFIALIAMPFVAGTHTPFGFFYSFLYDHFPGFSVFRTPYYKFAGAYFIGALALFSFTCSFFIEKLFQRVRIWSFLKPFIVMLPVILWLSFHWNLLDAKKIFSWNKGMSTKIQIPGYIWDFYNYSKQYRNVNEKILLVPQISEKDYIDSYTWGYWSLSPISYVLDSAPFISNEMLLTDGERVEVDALYQAIYESDNNIVTSLSKKLGIKHILLRRDAEVNDISKDWPKVLESSGLLKRSNVFGKWEVYDINTVTSPEIYGVGSIVIKNPSDLKLSQKKYSSEVVVDEEFRKMIPYKNISTEVESHSCQSCLVEKISSNINLPAVRILPNSIFYKIKDYQERKEVSSLKTNDEKINVFLGIMARRISESRSMLAMSINGKYIIEDINKANDYAQKLLTLFENQPKLTVEYEVANRVLNNSEPLLKSLYDFSASYDFKKSTLPLRLATYQLIETLRKISLQFSSLLRTHDYLMNNKLFMVDLSSSDYYLDVNSLSYDTSGLTLEPSFAFYYSLGNRFEAKVLKDGAKTGLLKISYDQSRTIKNETNDLVIGFNLPNLYRFEQKTVIPLPTGDHACLKGQILGFKPNLRYEISIFVNNKDQHLQLFQQDLSPGNYAGMDRSIDVYPLVQGEPFRIVTQELSSGVYLCSFDKDYPDISKIEIYQEFSPVIFSAKNVLAQETSSPVVSFNKVDRTNYKITIPSHDTSFILIFNQRFNPFWKLKDMGTRKTLINHFVADGYANAWLIESNQSGEFNLEYQPQRLFYWGLAVSLLSLFLLCLRLLKKK